MAQASVADIDLFDKTQSSLESCLSVLSEYQAQEISALQELQETVEQEVKTAESDLEAAIEEINQLQALLESLQLQLELAEAQLAALQAQLAMASMDPEEDTSGIEAEIEAVESQIEELHQKIDETRLKLEKAIAWRDKCQARLELAQQTYQIISQHLAEFEGRTNGCISSVSQNVETSRARLSAATKILNDYLATNPSAQAFADFIHRQYDPGKLITPADLGKALNLPPDQLDHYVRYLYQTDPTFRNKVNDYREKFKNANGENEKLKVLVQARRGGSGYLAENLVGQAFKPLGEVSMQNSTKFENGRFTKTDIVVTDLKNPVILGKGAGMGAPKGGSIAIEVKTGNSQYLYRQKEHMEFQSGGHKAASSSAVFCSKDIYDLKPDKEEELRKAMQASESPIIAILPRKKDLDTALNTFIVSGIEEST